MSPEPAAAPIASWSASFFTRLHRYKALLRRRWYVLGLCVALGLAYQAWQLATARPVYVSAARLIISPKINLTESSVYREEFTFFHGTQLELMRSAEVQARARARVSAQRPELAASSVRLDAFQQPRTNIFILTATGDEPAYTQAFLEAVLEEFINLRRQTRSDTTQNALAAITEQLVKAEKELNESETALMEFQTKNNVLFLEEQSNAAIARLREMNDELTQLRNDHRLLGMMDADQNLAHLRNQKQKEASPESPTGSPPLAPAAPEEAFLSARNDIGRLEVERDELAQFLKPAHPKIIALDQDIERQKKLIELYRQQSLQQLAAQRDTLALKIKNLEKSIEEEEQRGFSINRDMGEYQRLKKRQARAQGLYDQLLNSIQSVDVSNSLDQEIIAIQEHASPAHPERIGIASKLFQGAGLGFALGIGILLLLDRIDDRINSLTELRDHLDETVLGQIPHENTAAQADHQSLLVPDDPRHIYAESFRNVRSSLLFMPLDGERPRMILVTSAIPGEGKSTFAANLAITMAFSGAKVLLVDADLRRGRLHNLFQSSPRAGLSDALSGKIDWQEAVLETGIPQLHLLPRGSSPSNPGELFLSPSCQPLFLNMRDAYDFVVVDSAPMLATDDTASLGPKLDGTIFLLRTSYTSARLVHSALDQLYQRQVRVLGLVLTCVNTSLPEYYHYQYRSYYAKPPTSA